MTLPETQQTLPAPTVAWIERGRDLVQQRQEVDWRLAEWMTEGKDEGHLEQTKFDFLSQQLGISPKLLKDAQKAATVFPPSQRVPQLSVEHHAIVAGLDKEDALPLLKRASLERMKPHDLREAVTQKRYESGQILDDDDVDSTLCTHIIRAWNRATPMAREQFMELAELVGDSVIDEDVCY